MRILDTHIHLVESSLDGAAFAAAMRRSDVAGGFIFSLTPHAWAEAEDPAEEAHCAVDRVLQFCSEAPGLVPFCRLNAVAPYSPEIVEYAVKHGIAGFKIIHDEAPPSDPRAMALMRQIAATGKPLMLHCGILYGDGKQLGSRFNRPLEFELLLTIPHLRFSLAHLAWPWCDELIALYGEYRHMRRQKLTTAELFLDTTPGTPALYREEAFRHLWACFPDAARSAFFGSDNTTAEYLPDTRAHQIDRDAALLRQYGCSEAELADYFAGNAQRFLNGNQG